MQLVVETSLQVQINLYCFTTLKQTSLTIRVIHFPAGRIDDQKQEYERCQQQKKRRKIEDETRRQAALDRKRTIQEQIEKENKKLRELLSEAHDRLQLELNLKAQEHYHQQHSQVLHELVAEEHGIARDEVGL